MKSVEEQRRLQQVRNNDYLKGQVSYLNREVDTLRGKLAYVERQLEVLLATVNRLTEGDQAEGDHEEEKQPCRKRCYVGGCSSCDK